MIRKYKHIVWDWNGTLVDDSLLCHEITMHQLAKRGLPPLTLDTFRKAYKHPIVDFLTELGLVKEAAEFSTVAHEFHDLYSMRRHNLTLHQGVQKLLEQIIGFGLTQSILSAHPHEMLEEIVQDFEIAHFFSELVGLGDKLSGSKSQNGVEWLKRQAFSKSEVLLIGDTDHDLETAKAMGINCILVSNGAQHHDYLCTLGCCTVKDFDALVTTLLEE